MEVHGKFRHQLRLITWTQAVWVALCAEVIGFRDATSQLFVVFEPHVAGVTVQREARDENCAVRTFLVKMNPAGFTSHDGAAMFTVGDGHSRELRGIRRFRPSHTTWPTLTALRASRLSRYQGRFRRMGSGWIRHRSAITHEIPPLSGASDSSLGSAI